MAVNPGAELASINFGNLIGGPLKAVIEAQTMAAEATVKFIKDVGFNEDGTPVYVDFKYPKEIAPYQPAVEISPASVEVTNGGSGYEQGKVKVEGVTGATFDVTVDATGKITKIVGTLGTGAEPTVDTTLIITSTSSDTTPGTGATAKWKAKVVKPADGPTYATMVISVPFLTIVPIPFIRVEEATIDFNAKINSMETAAESSNLGVGGNLQVKQGWGTGSVKLNASFSYQKKSSSGSTVERTFSMQIHVRAVQDEMPAGMEKMLSILEGAMKSVPAPDDSKTKTT